MATFRQLPGTLNLEVTRGDAVSVEVDFDASLVGHSLAAAVRSSVSGSTIAAITATLVSGQNGVVTLSMTPEQTAALGVGTYAWSLVWTPQSGAARTALSGFLEVKPR